MRVQVNGDILDDFWGQIYDYFEIPCTYPQKIRQAVADCPEGEPLILEINSPGGSSFAGHEIYSVLRTAKCRTTAEIQSLAASAASIVMLGCDEVAASPVAQVMIHLPWTETSGDRYDHLDSVDVLDSVANAMLNAYVIKSAGRATRQELRSLMRSTTWLTAPEARDLGLVDRILGEETLDPSAVLSCCQGLGRGVRAMTAGLAGPDERREILLTRYRAEMAAGRAPEIPGLGLVEDSAAEDRETPLAAWNAIPHPAAALTPAPAEEQGNPEPTDSDFQTAMAALELEKVRFGGPNQ